MLRPEEEIREILKVVTNHRDSLLNSGVNEKKHIKLLNSRISVLKWILNER